MDIDTLVRVAEEFLLDNLPAPPGDAADPAHFPRRADRLRPPDSHRAADAGARLDG